MIWTTWLVAILGCSKTPDGSSMSSEPPTPPDGIDTVDTGFEPRDIPWACYGRGTIDYGDDGLVDLYRYEAYDPDHPDRLIRVEEDRWDTGDIGRFIDYAYDDRGNRILEAFGDGPTGVIELTLAWVYDDADRLLEHTIDTDGDGDPDYVEERAYDAGGQPLSLEQDLDGDGDVDVRYDYVYVNGLRVTLYQDSDADGTVDATYSYTYDAEDRPIAIVGIDSDGYPIYGVTYAYLDTHGSLLLEVDTDGDGVADEITESLYDASGQRVQERYDLDGDGYFEAGWYDIVSDAAGRFVSLEYVDDPPPAGGPQDRSAYTYVYEQPSGSWLSELTIHFRDEAGGPIVDGYREAYSWTCP